MQLPTFNQITCRLEQQVLFITLARPEVNNAMNLAMVEELLQLLSMAKHNQDIRALVFQGAGNNFCAGGDVKDMVQAQKRHQQGQEDAYYHFNRLFGQLLSQAEQSPKVVIALIDGYALGGGFGLVCVCDYVIATKKAHFALPETTLGLPPAQIAPFVVKRLGLTKTRELALFAESLDGEKAYAINLVNALVDDLDSGKVLLDKKLKQLTRCAPGATAITKGLLLNPENLPQEALLDLAAKQFSGQFSQSGAEALEGTRSFMEKRPPEWAVGKSVTVEQEQA
ncbi:enoyl-CoA hydratase/isomerase family protein [Thalassomonas haliotis]|uniref:Enoyl-CoA hydratase/isomerase family protein n=1 Tax=Thalassomonas haliotis TaxID=485448 RepID=A0ABY7V9A8_9GAMM|nr:enoyl-CoA hydratase/isomerase family protein [Thalassomonas haliotis]WDE09876.1 enoyl-CoA hydratase/isomerase family protein [Thalassomonas haliotis]